MNDFDKTGRYLIKRDAHAFFRWLLRRDGVDFDLWIDARRVVLPDQSDLTNDLVACFRVGGQREALIVELQAQARADTLLRGLDYLARLWTEPGVKASVELSSAGLVIVNLTGGGPEHDLRLCPTVAPACRLELAVLRRDLRRDDAAELLSDVAAGHYSHWLLGWVPLMQGGDDPAIIEQWKAVAEPFGDERERADLLTIVLNFAELAGFHPLWQRSLRRWNVQTASLFDQVRREGLRETIQELGRQRFGKPPTQKQLAALTAIAEVDRLARMRDRLLIATSWTDLLATP